MAIRIVRNESGNCINFYGATNPTYWNACLSGEVDAVETDKVNVINDIITAQTGVLKYEFYQIDYTELVDADGNAFANAQAAADYITEKANVTGVESDISLNGQVIDFKLDATSTSIMFNNGYSFGVNTIKAVPNPNGTIDIVSNFSNSTHDDKTYFTQLQVGNAAIDGTTVAGGLNDVINALNELFTVGAFTQVVISDPFATMVADVNGIADTDGALVGSGAVDPVGSDIGGNTGSHNNNAGWLSSATIDQAGEYFTFDIRGEGQIGFGLVHTQDSYDDGYYSGNATYANPATFCNGVNSAHYGYQFSHFFHPTPNGSWTNYGANTSYVGGSGWSGWESRNEWLAGDPVKIKCGIDEQGYIAIYSLQDDDVTWVLHARSGYPVPEGAEFKLGIKFSTTAARLASVPNVHLLTPAAPTLYFRYIESPDGIFQYPLFATEEEANYYDANHTNGVLGTGTSHAHVYADDPTGTTWYMPDTGSTMTDTYNPLLSTVFGNQMVAWTEITSQTNADLVPSAFADTTLTVDELSTINYQLAPVDVGYTTSISTSVTGWSLAGGTTLLGTAPEVTGDNVANPSDDYTVTVTRTNSYGSSTGTLTVRVNNLTAPVVAPISGFTFEGGTALIDSDTMADGSVVSITETLAVDERLVVDKEWLDNYVLPKITSGTGAKSVWIGFIAQNTTPNYTSIDRTDFRVAYEFYCDDAARAANNWRLKTHNQGGSFANVGIGSLTSGLYDYVFINDDAQVRAGALVASQGHNASTKVFDASNSDWNWTLYNASNSGSHKIIIATVGTDLDLSTANFNEYTEPVANTILTDWDKALDFSGSSERAQQVDGSFYRNAVKMANIATTVSAGATGFTSNDSNSRPWATSIVFKADGNNSNQHIWNVGEGAGSTDDNIYLRLDSQRRLWFGWGRSGALNECYVADIGGSISGWHGVYIASNGTRLSGGNATAANLADAFDIRYTRGNLSWSIGTNLSTSANWTSGSTGGRMDRQLTGDVTIGGRGANRNFHGKVAAMVFTTLRRGVAMPTDAEIEMMVTDPNRWLADYKVGNSFRLPWQSGNSSNFNYNDGSSAYATQIWLMGDGGNDSYSNMIRNRVHPSDQNYTKLNMISMVSNDIQTVTIQGLS